MKKTLLCAIVAITTFCAQAQMVRVEETETQQEDSIIIEENTKSTDFAEQEVFEIYRDYVLSIGPKVGASYVMAGDPDGMGDLGMSGNIGFSAGVAANLRFARPEGEPLGNERFGVQVEALYSMRTLKNDVEDLKLNCFEIPVLFQWYALPALCVEAGPTFTGVLSASPDNLKYNNTVYQTSEIKGYDVMLTIGAEYKAKNGFTAGIRYNMGNSELADNFKTKVSSLSVSIGWMFTLVK